MHGLHANQRQSPSPREQASGARTRREVNVLLQGAPQPLLFLGIEFGEGHEIAMKHILGFGTQHISKPAGHAETEIKAEEPKNNDHAAGHVLASMLTDAIHHAE